MEFMKLFIVILVIWFWRANIWREEDEIQSALTWKADVSSLNSGQMFGTFPSPDGQYLYHHGRYSNASQSTFTIFKTDLNMNLILSYSYAFKYDYRGIDMNPSGTSIYVAFQSDDKLYEISTSNLEITREIQL